MPNESRTTNETLPAEIVEPTPAPTYSYQKIEIGFGSAGSDSDARVLEELLRSADSQEKT